MGSERASLKRIILELGTGNALHSGDYTKAAKRAVLDAMHHSSITLFRSMNIDPELMQVELIVAAQQPDKVDLAAVTELVPFGNVEARAVKGGLDVVDETSGRPCVLVNAGVIVRVPL